MTNHFAFRTPHSAMERALAALNAIAAAVTQLLSLDEIVSAALDATLEATGFEVGGIALWDEEKQQLQPMAARGVEPQLLDIFLGPPRPGGNRERVLTTGQPVFHDDASHEPTVNPEIARLGFTIAGIVPLSYKGKVLGVLAIGTRASRQWTEEDKTLLTAVGQQIAVAVANARLYDEMQRSEERYRSLVNATTDLIFTVDLEGNILFANPAAKAFTGYEPQETIGHHFSEYVHSDDVPGLLAGIQQVLSGEPLENIRGVGRDAEYRMIRRDGQIVWVSTRSWLVRDAQGKIVGFSGITRDITERKRAEAALRRHLDELTVLQTIAAAGTGATSEGELMERATEIIGETFHLDNLGVILLDEASGLLRPHPSHRLRAGGEALTLHLGEGIVGQVALTGRPRRVPDVRLDPDYVEGDPQTRSELCVPMKVGERVIGVINTESTELDAYTEADERLLTTVAGQLATAIEKVRLFEQMEQRALEMTSLYTISLRLTRAEELGELLQTIVEQAAALLQANGGGLYLYDQATDELELAVVHGIVLEEDLGIRLQPGEGLSGKVMQERHPLVVDDYHTWEGRSLKFEGRPYTAVAAVPLLWRDQLVGVLDVTDDKERRTFSENDVRLLTLLAQQAAAAIANARLFEETRRLKEFNEGIIQSMAEGIFIEDANGTCTFVNPAAAEMLGYTIEELLGQRYTAIIPAEHRADIIRETAQRKEGIPNRYETVLLTKDGRRIPVIVSARPLFRQGRFMGVLSVFTDISEHKRAEEEIRRRADHLAALNAIITEAASATDLQELLERTLERTLQALGLEMGALWVEGYRAIKGVSKEIGRVSRQAAKALGVSMDVPIAVEDLMDETLPESHRYWARIMVERFGIRAAFSVPVLSQERRIGGLALAASEPRSWSDEEIALVEAVGRQIGAAAERLRLLAHTQEQARQMQQIMDSVPDGVVLLDANHRVITANPVAREYLAVLAQAQVGDILTHLADRSIEELLEPLPAGIHHKLTLEGCLLYTSPSPRD